MQYTTIPSLYLHTSMLHGCQWRKHESQRTFVLECQIISLGRWSQASISTYNRWLTIDALGAPRTEPQCQLYQTIPCHSLASGPKKILCTCEKVKNGTSHAKTWTSAQQNNILPPLTPCRPVLNLKQNRQTPVCLGLNRAAVDSQSASSPQRAALSGPLKTHRL